MLILTLMHPRVFILENGKFVNLAKFLKHRTESILLEMTRYLSDEELNGTLAVARRRRCRHGYQHILVESKIPLN